MVKKIKMLFFFFFKALLNYFLQKYDYDLLTVFFYSGCLNARINAFKILSINEEAPVEICCGNNEKTPEIQTA